MKRSTYSDSTQKAVEISIGISLRILTVNDPPIGVGACSPDPNTLLRDLLDPNDLGTSPQFVIDRSYRTVF